MFGSYKNTYGYAKKHLIITLVIALVMLGMSFGVYFLGIHLTGSNKNLLTLVAVLGMLPAGKELVNLIMCIKASKFTCSEDLFNRINELVSDDIPCVRYDLYVTAYDCSFPILAVTCFNDSVIGYTDYKAFNYNKFEEHFNTMLAQNGLKVSNIKIFDKETKFLERIEAFKNSDVEISSNDYSVIRLLENLSL